MRNEQLASKEKYDSDEKCMEVLLLPGGEWISVLMNGNGQIY